MENKREKTCFITFLTDMIKVTDRISESELDMNMRNSTRYETRALVEKTWPQPEGPPSRGQKGRLAGTGPWCLKGVLKTDHASLDYSIKKSRA